MLRNKRLKLKSCIKHYTLDQDKVVTPSETVKNTMARLEKMFELSHLRLEPRQSEIEGAYSYSSLSDQLNANGKGLTLEQSRASAIMEFAERYSWHYFDYKSCDGYVVKSFDQIKKGKIPTVEESYFLNHFAEIENRAEILSEIKNIPLKWVKGVSLMDYKEFYYPISWHNYAYTSNGLATGNALEEAVLQALCEVIERENVYRFFGECKEGNDLDQDSIGHPIICKALENAKKQGFEFIIKDISLDFKVPTFVVQGTREADKKYMHYQGCGFGTHPNPAKALIRALSEYFEGYSLMKHRLRELHFKWEEIKKHMPEQNYGFLNLINNSMLERRKKVVKLKDLPDLSRKDIKQEVEHIIKILKKHGCKDIVIIDKTHPKLDIPVVRVFIPKLRALLGANIHDPSMLLSEAYYEAGDAQTSEKYLRRTLLKTAYYSPDMAKAKPSQVFKEDYRQTILGFGGLKKGAVEELKKFEALLRKAQSEGS